MVTALEEGGGRQVVIDHIDSVVSYYITSTKYVCLRLLRSLGFLRVCLDFFCVCVLIF